MAEEIALTVSPLSPWSSMVSGFVLKRSGMTTELRNLKVLLLWAWSCGEIGWEGWIDEGH